MVWVRGEVTQVNLSHNFDEGCQIGKTEGDAVENDGGLKQGSERL
jgi:hypothetical protein